MGVFCFSEPNSINQLTFYEFFTVLRFVNLCLKQIYEYSQSVFTENDISQTKNKYTGVGNILSIVYKSRLLQA